MNRSDSLVSRLALAAALVLVLGSFAAAGEPITIQFMHWGLTDTYIERNERLIAEFERLNPDIKIERIQGGSNEDYDNALRARIAGGLAPDVFMVDLQYIPAFSDFALDLRPYVERTPEFGWESLAAAARDIMSVGNKIVGTLDSISPNVWFYNADMIELAGLEYPTRMWQNGGWTWEDFRDVSRKLYREDGNGNVLVWGNSAGTGQALNRLFMWSNGAPEYDDVRRPTRALYDAPEAIEAVRFVQEMQVVDRISLPFGQNPVFVNGDVGMMARWSSGIPAFGRTEGFRFGIAPYPIGPSEKARYASDIGASLFMVASTTKNPEAAWRWVAFLGSREAAPIFAELGPGAPIHPGIEIGFAPPTMLFPEVLFDLIDLPNQGNQYRLMSQNATEINQLVDAGFARIMRGEVPAETEMPEIARIVNAFLQQNPQ